MRSIRFKLSAILVFALAAVVAEAADFNEAIVISGGNRHVFAVELAVTPDEQARGLMYRERMANDAGMLFLFPERDHRAFWMKNTLISLDLLFIDTDGRIRKVHHRAVPGSLETIPSDYPVSAVLEINGGLAKRLGIKAGDKVEHPAFRARR